MTEIFYFLAIDLVLNIKRIKVYDEVAKRMESSLNGSRVAPYYFEQRVTRSFYLAPQRTSFRLEGVLNTPYYPEYCLVGILDRYLRVLMGTYGYLQLYYIFS